MFKHGEIRKTFTKLNPELIQVQEIMHINVGRLLLDFHILKAQKKAIVITNFVTDSIADEVLKVCYHVVND